MDGIRRRLIALRVKHGSKSAVGHRCSNLVKQLEHFGIAEGEQKTRLERLIRKTIKELTD